MLLVCTLTLIPLSSPPPHLYHFPVPVPAGRDVKGSFCDVLPLAWVLKYTSHAHSVNQKRKAMRRDVEYVPLHNSSADCRGSCGTARIGDTLPPADTWEEHPSAVVASVQSQPLFSGQLPLNWACLIKINTASAQILVTLSMWCFPLLDNF